MFDWLFKKKTTLPTPTQTNRFARIVVTVPADRTEYARVEAFSENDQPLGYWVGICKADAGAARAAGNPTCDWRRKFGETPTGEYEISEIRQPKNQEEEDLFGSGSYIVLSPLSGNAAIAEAQGRTVLLIHGGEASPTDGSIRLPDRAMQELLTIITRNSSQDAIRVSVIEQAQAINQTQAREIADDYDWQCSTNNSPSLFSLYCQYYMWDSLLNNANPGLSQSASYSSDFQNPDNQSPPTSDPDPATLALAGVQVLPDSITNNPVQLETPDPVQAPAIELERPEPTAQPAIELETPDPVSNGGDTVDTSNAYGR